MEEHHILDLNTLEQYNPNVEGPERIKFSDIGPYTAEIVRLIVYRNALRVEVIIREDGEEIARGQPVVNDHKSVRDFIKSSDVKDQPAVRLFFSELAHSFNKRQSTGFTLQIPRWYDIVQSPEETYQWIIFPLIAVGDLTMIGGARGSGKSSTLGEICIAELTKQPLWHEFPVHTVEKRPILWLDLEMGGRHFRQRGEALIKTVDPELLKWVSILGWSELGQQTGGEVPSPTSGAGLTTIRRVITELKPVLLLVDPATALLAYAGVDNPNNSVAVRRHIGIPFKNIALDFNLGVVMIDHTGKDAGRGLVNSLDKENAADQILMQSKIGKSPGMSTAEFTKIRAIDTEPYHQGYKLNLRYSTTTHRAIADKELKSLSPDEREALGFTLVGTAQDEESELVQDSAKQAKIREAREFIKQYPEATDEEIAQHVGKNRITVWRWRKEGRL